jgi:hypothetical protein
VLVDARSTVVCFRGFCARAASAVLGLRCRMESLCVRSSVQSLVLIDGTDSTLFVDLLLCPIRQLSIPSLLPSPFALASIPSPLDPASASPLSPSWISWLTHPSKNLRHLTRFRVVRVQTALVTAQHSEQGNVSVRYFARCPAEHASCGSRYLFFSCSQLPEQP